MNWSIVMNNMGKFFDSYLTDDSKKIIQHHKDQIEYSKECIKKLERQQLKEYRNENKT
jgi:hypothetical protein